MYFFIFDAHGAGMIGSRCAFIISLFALPVDWSLFEVFNLFCNGLVASIREGTLMIILFLITFLSFYSISFHERLGAGYFGTN